jgi:hypothetical protein
MYHLNIWLWCSSGFWHRVDSLVDASVSEKHTVSIFRAEVLCELSVLKMETCFSEMLTSTGESTQHQDPEDQHHPHHCENLKAHKYRLPCSHSCRLLTFYYSILFSFSPPLFLLSCFKISISVSILHPENCPTAVWWSPDWTAWVWFLIVSLACFVLSLHSEQPWDVQNSVKVRVEYTLVVWWLGRGVTSSKFSCVCYINCIIKVIKSRRMRLVEHIACTVR